MQPCIPLQRVCILSCRRAGPCKCRPARPGWDDRPSCARSCPPCCGAGSPAGRGSSQWRRGGLVASRSYSVNEFLPWLTLSRLYSAGSWSLNDAVVALTKWSRNFLESQKLLVAGGLGLQAQAGSDHAAVDVISTCWACRCGPSRCSRAVPRRWSLRSGSLRNGPAWSGSLHGSWVSLLKAIYVLSAAGAPPS